MFFKIICVSSQIKEAIVKYNVERWHANSIFSWKLTAHIIKRKAIWSPAIDSNNNAL